MGSICKVINGVKAAFLMVMVQVAYAVCTILYKLVEKNNGMSLCVLVAYRYIFASIFMLPLAYFADRSATFLCFLRKTSTLLVLNFMDLYVSFNRKSKPKITAKVLFQAFLCGLFG